MHDSIGVPVKHVSDTAFMVAAWRAVESRRPDACINDPLAEVLAGEMGMELIKRAPGFNSGDWFMALRTSAMDEMILDLVRGGVDTVLNLAAGLDTRPYRLDLPERLRWVEVDLPGIIQYKVQKLSAHKPKCQLEHEIVDLTDAEARDGLMAEISAEAKQALVITEGLLYYLTKEDVEALGTNIRKPTFKWWMMDLVSPGMFVAMKKTWDGNLAPDDVRFKFVPENPKDFYEPLGWREARFRSYEEQGSRVKRQPPDDMRLQDADVKGAVDQSGILLLTHG